MRFTKKIFILLSMFFLVIASKVFATEKIEAVIVNKISKENNYTPAVFYNTADINLPKNIRANYMKQNRLNVGVSAQNASKFDLRDKISINIRDQKESKLCWIYSTNTILETNLKMNNINLNSEFDVIETDEDTAKVYNKSSSNGTTDDYEGGTQFVLLNYYTSGAGPKNLQNQNIDVEIEDFVIFPSIYKEIQNGEVKYYDLDLTTNIRTNYSEEDVLRIRNQIKNHIMKYGAVGSNVYSEGTQYYDTGKDLLNAEAYYCDDPTKIVDHGITIIGWNDNYSRENFNPEHRPINDGAYIVLNSWGEKFSKDGVYYVSYDDYLIENMICGIEKAR